MKIKLGPQLSLCGYVVLLCAYTLFAYTELSVQRNFSTILTLFKIVSIILMLLGALFQKYHIWELLLYICLGGLGLLIYKSTGISDIMITLIAVISLKSVPFKSIVKTDFVSRTLLTIVIMVAASINMIPSNDFYSNNKLGFIRHSLGFYHPNLLGAYILILTIEFVFLMYTAKKNKTALLSIPFSVIFLELVSNSRSAELALMLYLVVFCLLSRINITSKLLKAWTVIATVFVSSLSIVSSIMYNYSSSFWFYIDQVLSGRPRMIHTVVTEIYPIRLIAEKTSLLGLEQGINLNGKISIFFIDNSYMSILIKYGMLAFIIFIVWMITNSFKYLNQSDKLIMFCWLIALLFWGMSEGKLLAIQFNILLFSYVKHSEKVEEGQGE